VRVVVILYIILRGAEKKVCTHRSAWEGRRAGYLEKEQGMVLGRLDGVAPLRMGREDGVWRSQKEV